MYVNLLAEMKKNRITQKAAAEKLKISENAMSAKMFGKSKFSSDEMFEIKNKFFPDKTLEYLFEKK